MAAFGGTDGVRPFVGRGQAMVAEWRSSVRVRKEKERAALEEALACDDSAAALAMAVDVDTPIGAGRYDALLGPSFSAPDGVVGMDPVGQPSSASSGVVFVSGSTFAPSLLHEADGSSAHGQPSNESAIALAHHASDAPVSTPGLIVGVPGEGRRSACDRRCLVS